MRWYRAPAKLNLTLQVLRRRSDGFHEIESLVAFAGESDWLGFAPGRRLALVVEGNVAGIIGPIERNLVMRAARALAARVPGLCLGEFHLLKRLPVAAGLGGGSSDAAACIRALAEANGLLLSDDRVTAAALDTGSDVPVCVSPRARTIAGVGDRLGAPSRLPPLFAVLVNPRQALGTREVFEELSIERGVGYRADSASFVEDVSVAVTLEVLKSGRNDLERAAQRILPIVGDILDKMKRLPGAKVVRMSGSGATCFAVFDVARAARIAQEQLAVEHPGWWITSSVLR